MGGPIPRARLEPPPTPTSRVARFVEVIVVLVIMAAVVAMAIWFIFISSGGIGPGTV
jgi:hypothetical protein